MGRHRKAPTVFRRKDSPYLRLMYYDRNGKRIMVSSGKTSEFEAWQELERRLMEMEASQPLPVATVFRQFLDSRVLKTSSLASYQLSMRRWSEYLDGKNVTDFTKVTKDLVREFIAERRRQDAKDATIRRDISILSMVWIFLSEETEWEERMPGNPVRGVGRSLKRPEQRVRVATPEEWEAILNATTSELQRFFVTVAVETGMTDQELCALTWSQIDLANRLITVTSSDKSRYVPISDACLGVLQAIQRHATSPYVFWIELTGRPLATFSNSWRAIRRRSGVTDFQFHDIRDTFAMRYLDAGGGLGNLPAILGTVSLQRYDKLLGPYILEEMRRVFSTAKDDDWS